MVLVVCSAEQANDLALYLQLERDYGTVAAIIEAQGHPLPHPPRFVDRVCGVPMNHHGRVRSDGLLAAFAMIDAYFDRYPAGAAVVIVHCRSGYHRSPPAAWAVARRYGAVDYRTFFRLLCARRVIWDGYEAGVNGEFPELDELGPWERDLVNALDFALSIGTRVDYAEAIPSALAAPAASAASTSQWLQPPPPSSRAPRPRLLGRDDAGVEAAAAAPAAPASSRRRLAAAAAALAAELPLAAPAFLHGDPASAAAMPRAPSGPPAEFRLRGSVAAVGLSAGSEPAAAPGPAAASSGSSAAPGAPQPPPGPPPGYLMAPPRPSSRPPFTAHRPAESPGPSAALAEPRPYRPSPFAPPISDRLRDFMRLIGVENDAQDQEGRTLLHHCAERSYARPQEMMGIMLDLLYIYRLSR